MKRLYIDVGFRILKWDSFVFCSFRPYISVMLSNVPKVLCRSGLCVKTIEFLGMDHILQQNLGMHPTCWVTLHYDTIYCTESRPALFCSIFNTCLPWHVTCKMILLTMEYFNLEERISFSLSFFRGAAYDSITRWLCLIWQSLLLFLSPPPRVCRSWRCTWIMRK